MSGYVAGKTGKPIPIGYIYLYYLNRISFGKEYTVLGSL
jgi:hypothetical protein